MSYNFFKPNYEVDKSSCFEFLNNFEDQSIEPDRTFGKIKYRIEMQKVANGQQRNIDILVEDLQEFFNGEQDALFVDNIIRNSKRYVELFSQVVDDLMPNPTEENLNQPDDIMLHIRETNYNLIENNNTNNIRQKIPAELKRKYDLRIIYGPNSKLKITPLRNLKSDLIGHLVVVRGMIVRVSDVKPIITVATYTCDVCGFELYQTIKGKTFMPKVDCESPVCKINKTRGKLFQIHAYSKFQPYQEIKIQETSDQIPIGSIPRSFNVIARGSNTRQCSPGDIVTLTGIFLPQQYESFRNRTALIHDTFIEAFKIVREKLRYTDTLFSEELITKIQSFNNAQDVYTKLSRSIAPEIYGMDDVKRSLLLLLVGGSSTQMGDGLKIRGDINIALIGDPGVAKSQLLKQISRLTPRGVYTTGKGSSGVGLTAAVVRDPISNEISLEGGALVLADLGVCCIDEFDKMEESDRTAIHEVMEQQTVSIAKAGITTTLNARTSILAAANPIYGRYNKRLTPHQNINLPAALLSRFDLVFLLLDKPDRLADELMSRHIAFVHKNNAYPQIEQEIQDAEFIRAYIAQAKKFDPKIPKHLHEFIVQRYVEKRREHNDVKKKGYAYTTPRTLLAIIRLAQAHARLRFSDEVDQSDIDEALRLMESSRASIEDDDEDLSIKRIKKDKISAIFEIISETCRISRKNSAKFTDVQNRIVNKGFSTEEFQRCLAQYQELGVLVYNESRNKIDLV